MDAARQIVRWSIPGSVFLLITFINSIIIALSLGFSLPEILRSGVVRGLNTPLIILLAASGIPLGFLIYQIYYASQSRGVISGKRGYVKLDHGSEFFRVLGKSHWRKCIELFRCAPIIWKTERVSILGVPILRLQGAVDVPSVTLRNANHGNVYELSKIGCPTQNTVEATDATTELIQVYIQNREANRHLFKSYMDYACSLNERSTLKREYTTLMDLYHGMGASRIGAVLGAASGIAVALLAYNDTPFDWPWTTSLGFVVVLIFTATITITLHRTRMLCWQSILNTVRFDMSWLLDQR